MGPFIQSMVEFSDGPLFGVCGRGFKGPTVDKAASTWKHALGIDTVSYSAEKLQLLMLVGRFAGRHTYLPLALRLGYLRTWRF